MLVYSRDTNRKILKYKNEKNASINFSLNTCVVLLKV